MSMVLFVHSQSHSLCNTNVLNLVQIPIYHSVPTKITFYETCPGNTSYYLSNFTNHCLISSPDTKEWEVPSITMDTHSHYRMGHTATFDPKVKCLYVFGGSKNLRWYNDIHVLDLDNWKWSLVKVSSAL